jgi:hypothetical protein
LGPKYYHNLSCKTWDDFRERLSAHIRKVYLRSCKQDTQICEKLFKDTAANEDAGIQMYGFTRKEPDSSSDFSFSKRALLKSLTDDSDLEEYIQCYDGHAVPIYAEVGTASHATKKLKTNNHSDDRGDPDRDASGSGSDGREDGGDGDSDQADERKVYVYLPVYERAFAGTRTLSAVSGAGPSAGGGLPAVMGEFFYSADVHAGALWYVMRRC